MLRVSLLISGLAVAGAIPLGNQWYGPSHHPPELAQSAESHAEHPLAAVLELARDTQSSVHSQFKNFRCRLLKRERIDGQLQTQRVIEMQVRECGDDDPTAAFAARMDFLEPAELVGRRILFVDGANDNRMLVRKGGKRLHFVVLKLDPRGWKAKDESFVPITEVGFHRMLEVMVRTLEQQIEADPRGDNTQVQWQDNFRWQDRPCRMIRITHPQPSEALQFHRAVVLIDRELGVPIHIAAYGWPDVDEGDSPLLAEYTYADLAVNVRLEDDCFNSDALSEE